MTLMFSEDIVHALAARDGCEGFVIVCDDTIRILYDAADKTFVCSRERTKCRTLAEALQQHAGVRRRHNFLDIAKIYGVTLRAIAKHARLAPRREAARVQKRLNEDKILLKEQATMTGAVPVVAFVMPQRPPPRRVCEKDAEMQRELAKCCIF